MELPKTPQGQVRAVFKQFQDAFRAEDAEGICAAVTPRAQQRSVKAAGKTYDSCVDVAQGLIDRWGSKIAGRPKVESLRVKGDAAVMAIRTSGTATQKVSFVKTADGWKFDEQIGGSF